MTFFLSSDRQQGDRKGQDEDGGLEGDLLDVWDLVVGCGGFDVVLRVRHFRLLAAACLVCLEFQS
jgi:hypothetical protein